MSTNIDRNTKVTLDSIVSILSTNVLKLLDLMLFLKYFGSPVHI